MRSRSSIQRKNAPKPKCKYCYDKCFYTRYSDVQGSANFGGEGFTRRGTIVKVPCPRCQEADPLPDKGEETCEHDYCEEPTSIHCPKCGRTWELYEGTPDTYSREEIDERMRALLDYISEIFHRNPSLDSAKLVGLAESLRSRFLP
jgi:hypothetical protein